MRKLNTNLLLNAKHYAYLMRCLTQLIILVGIFLGQTRSVAAESFALDAACTNSTEAQFFELTGLLCLPVVAVKVENEVQYYAAQLKMNLIEGTSNFTLVKSQPIAASESNAPTFNDTSGLLIIPEVVFTKKSGLVERYTAELKMLPNSNPITFSVLTLVSAYNGIAPNLYTLSGDNIKISYSTTSLDGKPQFSYQDQKQTLNFRGDQIRREETNIGTLVSVTTLLTTDSGSYVFSVLLPRVNLKADQSLPIQSVGISTLLRFSISPISGQVDFYKVIALEGTAEQVFF